MNFKTRILPTSLMVFCTHTFAASQPLPSVVEFIETIKNNHPYVHMLAEKTHQAEFDLLGAQTAFDPLIQSDFSDRIAGYYQGSALSGRYIQPLNQYNARFTSEYRISNSNLPVYEQQYETLSAGEANFGIELSLLKNREIDKTRLDIKNAKLEINQTNAAINIELNSFIYKGLSHYLTYLQASLKEQTIEGLINVLKRRKDGLKRRVESGDLAPITLTEFDAIILEQNIILATIKQSKLTAQQALSFYIRDNKHQIVQPNFTPVQLATINWPYSLNKSNITVFEQSLEDHPKLASLKTKRQIIGNKQSLAENKLLPKLDLKALIAKDIGNGSQTLKDTEAKVGLSFSYTLGNRKAKTEKAKLQSQSTMLDYQYTLSLQQIQQDFQQAYLFWQQANHVKALQQESAELALTLSILERKRFDQGDSDLFKLNSRESTLVKTQLKAIDAHMSVMAAELDVMYLMAKLI
jgi:outer membrane protein TolC